MNTKTLSASALTVIDQYVHFSVGGAVCSVPYFNNKTGRMRAALRAYIGKGSPKDIHEEVMALLLKNHIAINSIADEALKKLLTDNNIGIDCSGLAYYILDAESIERGKKSLSSNLAFINRTGFLGGMRAKMRPVENCDVATLANDENSRVIALKEIQPGDMVTMMSELDHVLVVHQVDYQNEMPSVIYYTHAIAYPEDGVYGTGVRQGKIEVSNASRSILEAKWSEQKLISENTYKIDVRRLKWF